jgi:hypothetical protein
VDLALVCGQMQERLPDLAVSPCQAPFSPREGGRTIGVGAAFCTVRMYSGCSGIRTVIPFVTPDDAGDLSLQARLWFTPLSGDLRGPVEWLVAALAFVEQEAEEACERASAVLAELCWGRNRATLSG